MDVMFGTFHYPGHMPRRYGIPEDISHNYAVQLIDPVLPKRLRKGLQRRLRRRRNRRAAPAVATAGR